MKKDKELCRLPEFGDDIKLKTKSGTTICTGYERVVFGGRGPYVEFNKNQLIDNAFFVPNNQLYRLSDSRIYYIEFRSNDDANVKLYYQLRCVAYADYKLGYFYISPYDLYMDSGECCMITEIAMNESLDLFFGNVV